MPDAVSIESISHRYGDRVALDHIDLTVEIGTMFGLLGPNGGGKTTLFRLMATLLPPQSGRITIFGHDVATESRAVRRRLGIVFQNPGLDPFLTVHENLLHQGRLYGVTGKRLRGRIDEMMAAFDLGDRSRQRVRELSGGFKRRVELARAFLSDPDFLLLDEPTTGLDPGARREFWKMIERRRVARPELTLLLTTHLLDEADRCDRLALLDAGHIKAVDTPEGLKSRVGGDVVTLTAREPERLLADVQERFDPKASLTEGEIRLEHVNGHDLASQLATAFAGQIDSVRIARPTLDDVFIRMTGRRLEDVAS
ncbi:MAG: ABC transporter ATP-binding protein [Candidatus Eisenbacteria bacterium]|nr:ABC transporter ATP-binding protein [Candidatus Eisenbacteria bacterium]